MIYDMLHLSIYTVTILYYFTQTAMSATTSYCLPMLCNTLMGLPFLLIRPTWCTTEPIQGREGEMHSVWSCNCCCCSGSCVWVLLHVWSRLYNHSLWITYKMHLTLLVTKNRTTLQTDNTVGVCTYCQRTQVIIVILQVNPYIHS